ncbi:MAG TPA: multiheme c-type cytochrome, partial [Candidatus Manganitrophaceae bacterium]|nr:multiheme c-type cytochrome [Candidatus Manganitrophaceae bacterium]
MGNPLHVCFLLIFLLWSARAHGESIEGLVVDEGGAPLPDAVIRIQATETSTRTDFLGRFWIDIGSVEEVVLTAWKEGRMNGWVKAAPGKKKAVITLKSIPLGDNKDYRWISPDPPTLLEKIDIAARKALVSMTGKERWKSRFERNCSHCHADLIVAQWRQDAHARSAKNPIFLSMYNGTDAAGRTGIFPGYKLDFPKSQGNCAHCHVPLHALTPRQSGDLTEATGLAKEGISCDFCHKIRDVDVRPDRNYPGALSIKFNRPPQGKQVFLGPYDDAVAGPDTYAAIYKESRFCAPCHNAAFWGTPIYSEFEEWSNSPYSKAGTSCQDCHMPPDGVATHVAPPEKGGVKRDPKTIPSHRFRGPGDLQFMSEAVKLELDATWEGSVAAVRVGLSNEKAGHHIPTGVPMRNMILLVEALDSEGRTLKTLEGPVVPEWGGVGRPEEGNYAGLPGKGFAKVLADVAKDFPRPTPDFRIPAPHWRQTTILSDSRIPAKGRDTSYYRFKVDSPREEKIKIRAK